MNTTTPPESATPRVPIQQRLEGHADTVIMTSVRETFGLACPRCDHDDHILIEATEFVRLVPDGTISASDQEWALDSKAHCAKCDYSGIVADFEPPCEEVAS